MMQGYGIVRSVDKNYQIQAQKKSMPLKWINVVDPTFSKNNLGKSISRLNASRIQ